MPSNLNAPIQENLNQDILSKNDDSKMHSSVLTRNDKIDEEGPVFAPHNEIINSHADAPEDKSLNSREEEEEESENLAAS